MGPLTSGFSPRRYWSLPLGFRCHAGYSRDHRRVTATTTTVPVFNIRASYPTGESREPGGQHSTDRQLSPGVGRRSSGGDPRVRPVAVLRRVSICLASRSIVEDDEIELGQPLGVGEDVEIDDLVVLDRDAEDGEHCPPGRRRSRRRRSRVPAGRSAPDLRTRAQPPPARLAPAAKAVRKAHRCRP